MAYPQVPLALNEAKHISNVLLLLPVSVTEDRWARAAPEKLSTTALVETELEEEDEELETFQNKPVVEKLDDVIEYLRMTFKYCFWCKYQYPDQEMEGCPGSTEEDHD